MKRSGSGAWPPGVGLRWASGSEPGAAARAALPAFPFTRGRAPSPPPPLHPMLGKLPACAGHEHPVRARARSGPGPSKVAALHAEPGRCGAPPGNNPTGVAIGLQSGPARLRSTRCCGPACGSPTRARGHARQQIGAIIGPGQPAHSKPGHSRP